MRTTTRSKQPAAPIGFDRDPRPSDGASIDAQGLRRWLDAVVRISAAVNNMEPLDNVLDSIASTTCQLLGYQFGAVLLADVKASRLVIRGSHGLSPAYINELNSTRPPRIGHGPYGESPSSRAFTSHQPVVIADTQEDPSFVPWAGAAFEQGYHSLAAIPMVVSGRAIGTLACYTEERHDFGSDELTLLVTIANQAAIAIEAARFRERERATIAHLREARRSLEAQTDLLRRSEEIHENLTRTVLEAGGLEEIASALGEILRGSVVIDDADGRVLARWMRDDPAAPLPGWLHTELSLAEAPTGEAASVGPSELVITASDGRERRTFMTPIVSSGELVARLWVVEPETDLGPLERRALEHGTTVIALKLMNQQIASEVEGRLRGELLDDLLSERALDPEILRLRASHLGHTLEARHLSFVAAADMPDGAALSAEHAEGQARQILLIVQRLARRHHLDALVGIRGNRVAALVAHADLGMDRARQFADAIRREARQTLPAGSASVAIGPVAQRTAELSRSYRIARGALDLAQRNSRDRTIAVGDLGMYGLMLSVDRVDELERFAAAKLDPIRRYDERKGSELVATLKAYLAHSCKTADTAQALIVHPNTVAYRVHRIERLLDLDLSRAESQLELQLALIVEEIRPTSRSGAPR